jgi:hypothetical protein
LTIFRQRESPRRTSGFVSIVVIVNIVGAQPARLGVDRKSTGLTVLHGANPEVFAFALYLYV